MVKKDQLAWENGNKLSRKQLQSVENKLEIKFPADYVDIVLEHDGAQPNMDNIDFPDGKAKDFGDLLPINQELGNSIIKTLEYRKKDYPFPEKVIPFADDAAGNLYCFDYRQGSNPTIIYWEHELSCLHDKHYFIFVADSFNGLLDKLYETKDQDSVFLDPTQYQIIVSPDKSNKLATFSIVKSYLGLNTVAAKQLIDQQESILLMEDKAFKIVMVIDLLQAKGIHFQIKPEFKHSVADLKKI